MKDDLARVTGLTSKERSNVLSWFEKQAETIRIEIMMGRFHNFHKLKKRFDHSAPILDYCALILSCKALGWLADAKYRSKASLSSTELTRISHRRIARANEGLQGTTREQLAVHWGKVVELKNAGLGFRRIARFLSTELRLHVSHTTIWKHWKEWESNER